MRYSKEFELLSQMDSIKHGFDCCCSSLSGILRKKEIITEFKFYGKYPDLAANYQESVRDMLSDMLRDLSLGMSL